MVIPRHPQVTDFAFLGTLWIDPTDQSAWVLVAILANQAQWIPVGVINDLGIDGVVVTNNAGVPSSVNGTTQWQVLFANPGASPAFGSILPGTGITFDETVANQITINATNAGTITAVNGTVNQIDVNTVAGVATVSLDPVVIAPGSVRATTALRGNTLTVDSQTNGVLTTNGTGVVAASNGTNGQVLIGGGTAPAWNTLTAGSNITITNTANGIAIAAFATATNYGFSAHQSANVDNATGDWTAYNIIFDTIDYTDGGYDNTTGIYTAPVAGRYLLAGTISFYNLQDTHVEAHYVVQLNGAEKAEAFVINPYPICALSVDPYYYNIMQTLSMILYLNAGDTINCFLSVGRGTKVVGVRGDPSSRRYTWLSVNILR
jgi:hypothetical protein